MSFTPTPHLDHFPGRQPAAPLSGAIARFEQEVDRLWHDSMTSDDQAAAGQLVAVSLAIRNATRLLDGHLEIG